MLSLEVVMVVVMSSASFTVLFPVRLLHNYIDDIVVYSITGACFY